MAAASSPPLSAFWVAVAIAIAALLVGLTTVQEPPCRNIIYATWLAYSSVYGILRSTGLLQPSPGSIKPGEMAEWRSRLLSFSNGIILTVGSLLCFSEWPYEGAEGFVSQHLWSHPVTFASLFVGYLQHDLVWVLWHQKSTPDVPAIIHHTMFIAITHYVLWGWYFKQPYAWLSFAELSTPFLNARWFYAVSKRKNGTAYFVHSVAFAVTFLVTRVLGYTLGVWNLWANYALWRDERWGLYGVVAGCHAGLALNLFWSRAVVKHLVRAVKGGGKAVD